MPISITCPKCGTTAIVPDTAAGAKARCKHCGHVVQIPVQAPKECCMCGVDVTHQKRVRDEDGSYYCEDCAKERFGTLAGRSSSIADAAVIPAVSIQEPPPTAVPQVSMPAPVAPARSEVPAPAISDPEPASSPVPPPPAQGPRKPSPPSADEQHRRRMRNRVNFAVAAVFVISIGVAWWVFAERKAYQRYSIHIEPAVAALSRTRELIDKGIGFEEFSARVRVTEDLIETATKELDPGDLDRESFQKIRSVYEQYRLAAQEWDKQVRAAAGARIETVESQEPIIIQHLVSAGRGVQEIERLLSQRD